MEDIRNALLMLKYVVLGGDSCIVVKQKRAFKTAMCLQVIAQMCQVTDLNPHSIIDCTQDLF
jgi:arginine exporter protein ArgO